MKRKILSIALLLSVVTSLLTSCMVAQDRGGRRSNRDHHRNRGHHGPYDSNGYRHYNNNY